MGGFYELVCVVVVVVGVVVGDEFYVGLW